LHIYINTFNCYVKKREYWILNNFLCIAAEHTYLNLVLSNRIRVM